MHEVDSVFHHHHGRKQTRKVHLFKSRVMLYSYLSPEDKEIRLLRLLPGNEDIIEAELHIVSLNTNPSYEVCNHVGQLLVAKTYS